MEVILKKDVDNLGFEYEVVNVKTGYARNFLIPNAAAILATKQAKEDLDVILKKRDDEESALINEANEKLNKLNSIETKLSVKAGNDNKLFGSINNADLAAYLVKQGLTIEKKNIKIAGNIIKRIGSYSAKIRFHRNVESDYNFEVVAENKK